MRIKTFLSAIIIGFGIVGLTNNSIAQAKTWHYKVTKSNQFSTKFYSRAFMYGGEHNDFMTLYTNAKGAASENVDSLTGRVLGDTDRNQIYYAKKLSSFSNVMALKFKNKIYYVNLKEAKLYRFNTWRRGHKLISLTQPTNTRYVVLKAKTHVYRTQPWWYNYSDKFQPEYLHYKLSTKNNWYLY